MTKLTPDTRSSIGTRTRLVHAGRDPDQQFGFLNTPVYRGSTVLYDSVDDLRTRKNRYTYGTHGTPTSDALTTAWSEIAGAAGTVLTPSGIAAIAMALMSVVKAGDHVLVTRSAYQPTRGFCETILKRYGVETTAYDPLIGGAIEQLFRPNTRAVLVEAPGSLTFDMQDIPAIAAAAHARDICVIGDNTWATPLFFPPHARGVDIAVEAGTKYLSGHSDGLMGLVSANERYWPELHRTWDTFGILPGGDDIFLALRGLRTMDLRLHEAERQGLAMATWLADRPEVAHVLHPAFPDHPGHAIWKRDFSGSSGLFSIVLKPVPDAALVAMLDGLELFGMGYSWGGFQSLVIPFHCPEHGLATSRIAAGQGLRLQIGFEDVKDLQADLERGFGRLHAA